MVRIGSLWILGGLLCKAVLGCTGFALHTDQGLLFARNTDLPFIDAKLVRNEAGVKKIAYVPYHGTKPLRWTSRYRSLTLNHVGVDFPNEGMNEKGLVVAPYTLVGGVVYPKQMYLPNINEFQHWQYVLDTSATIEEAAENLNRVNFCPLFAQIHLLVCDRSRCVVFEGTSKKFLPRDLNKIPAIANWSYLDQCARFKSRGKKPKNKHDRFGIAAEAALKKKDWNYPEAVDFAFETLARVKQGSYTAWHMLYDTATPSITIKNPRNNHTKTFSLDWKKEGEFTVYDLHRRVFESKASFKKHPKDIYCSRFLSRIWRAEIKRLEDFLSGS